MPHDGAGWTADRMIARLEGDEALARELVELFLEEYDTLLRALEASVEAGNPERVRTAAHALKGCIGNFTDADAYLTAFDIEQRSADSTLGELPALIQRLDGQLDDLTARMRAFMGER